MAHRSLTSSLPALAGLRSPVSRSRRADTVPPPACFVETVPNSYYFASDPDLRTGPEIVVTSRASPSSWARITEQRRPLHSRAHRMSYDEFAYGVEYGPLSSNSAIGPDDGLHAVLGPEHLSEITTRCAAPPGMSTTVSSPSAPRSGSPSTGRPVPPSLRLTARLRHQAESVAVRAPGDRRACRPPEPGVR